MTDPISAGALAEVATSKAVLSSLVTFLVKAIPESAAKRWHEIDWLGKEREYRSRLIKQLNAVRVLGKSHEISLDQIFTDVYVLTEIPSERYPDFQDDVRSDEILRRLRERAARDRRKIDDVIVAENHIYLLGAPGAGKTTLMRRVAIQAARGLIERLPIYIPLREVYQAELKIEHYIEKALELGGAPDPDLLMRKLLEAGELLLLFDGLDEIPRSQDRRIKYLRQIQALAKQYPRCRLVISCRTAASAYSIEGFKYLELAEFDEAQQSAFLKQWFGSDTVSHGQFLAIWHEDSNRGLRDLASSPLLLTLLCLAFASTGYFPRKKIDLFRDAVNALVYQWDTSRGVERDGHLAALAPRRKDHLFQSLAYHTFVEADYVFDEATVIHELQRYLNMLPPDGNKLEASPELVRELAANHGVIVERAIRLFSFSHLSIHEYLTARYLAESATSEEWQSCLRRETVTDDRWREVISALASMKPNATEIMDSLIAATRSQGERSEPVASTMKQVRSLLERGGSSGNVPKVIGAVTFQGTRRRRLGAREERYVPPLQRALTAIGEHLKVLDPASQSALSKRFGCWVHLIGRCDVELFDLLRRDANDPDKGLEVLTSYFQMLVLVLDCARVAALSRPRHEYLDALL